MHPLFRYLCVISCVLIHSLSAVASSDYLLLKGYLGRDELAPARNQVKKLADKSINQLLIEVNSVSGDLNSVLELATQIYALRQQKPFKLIVYIDQNALGPAAIVPFLADELDISPFVSWGDIPYGAESILPTNILRNRVQSLVPEGLPKEALLQLIAAGMSDPDLVIVDQSGWKIAQGALDSFAKVISGKGEALIVNRRQLQELGLVRDVLSPEAFHKQYETAVVPIEPVVEISSSMLSGPKSELEKQLAAHIIYNPNGPNKIGRIVIDDRTTGITPATWLYVKSALDSYRKTKPIFIILELNTPGGQVYPAQQISDALKEIDTQNDIPVVAYINNWAISAGAMLAYSCRFIAVVKDGSMGAAEPVLMGAEGQMVTASEKVNSALRADFANRASFFGRNPLLAECMVDKDPILVLRHDKIVKLDSENEIKITGPDRDIVIKPKGKLLTLNASQLITYGVADILVPPVKLSPITEAERELGEWPANKIGLFTLPFFNRISNATIETFQPDWRVQFLAFLAQPLVSSLLLMGLMIGFYMEMSSPGAALPGSVAIICLLLIILSSYAQTAAIWLEVILLLAGIVLLATEVFVLPTWGLLGFAGLVAIIVGLFGLMLPSLNSVSFDVGSHTFNAAGQVFVERLAWFCGTLVLSVVIMVLLWRYVAPGFKPLSRLVLLGEQNASQGFFAGPDPRTLPQPGAKGVATATLRPAGKILINDRLYDAVSAGDFIDEGESVVIIRLDGGKIVVVKESVGIRQ